MSNSRRQLDFIGAQTQTGSSNPEDLLLEYNFGTQGREMMTVRLTSFRQWGKGNIKKNKHRIRNYLKF